MPQTKKRLESFGALRALCCLSVILLHTHVTVYTGYLGVTTFFIMSGFLLVYNYYDRTELDAASVSLCFRFAHGKVKKLYPLHLLTMALFVAEYAYALITGLAKPTLQLFAPFIANVLLIQTWFPSENFYFSFNIVSWYLSVSAFLYFMFPLVLKAVRRLRSTAQAAVLCVLLFAVQAAVSYCGCGSAWLGAMLGRNGGTVQWLLQVFPPMRLPAFWIGCNLGYIFLKTENRVFTKAQAAVFEALTVLAAVCSLCTGLLPKSAPRLPAFFDYSLKYMLPAAMLVLAFAYARDPAVRLLTNRVMLHLGRLSPYIYLIHYPVIAATALAVTRLPCSFTVQRVLYLVSAAVFTYVFSVLYASRSPRKKRESAQRSR